MNVIVAGTGNAAWHFCRMTLQGGHRLVAILSRHPENNRSMGEEFNAPLLDYTQVIPRCDLIILAVKDQVISETSRHLSTQALVVHVSGSTELNALSSSRKGVIWPLQTLTRGVEMNYANVPFCIEYSDEADGQLLAGFLKPLHAPIQRVSSEERFCIHLAAVIACNFSNHLYTIAVQILEEKGLEVELLHPLIEETAKKIRHISPKHAQTGPAVRGDVHVMERQQAMLSSHPEWQQLYQLMSALIQSNT